MRASLSFAGRRTCKLCRTSRLNGFTAVLAGSVSGFLACCFTGAKRLEGGEREEAGKGKEGERRGVDGEIPWQRDDC